MSTETQDTTETTLAALEAQIVRLPAPAQLQLVARISARLSDAPPAALRGSPAKTYPPRGERATAEQREQVLIDDENDAEGTTDSAVVIRQIDHERDEQIKRATSRGKRRPPTPFKRPTNDTDEGYTARMAEIESFLAACDDIAKDMTGTFDSVADIRRMRDEDDG